MQYTIPSLKDSDYERSLVSVFPHTCLKPTHPDYKDVLREPPDNKTYKTLLMKKGLADQKWELAIEIATQAGLDGEKVANILAAFVQTAKTVR